MDNNAAGHFTYDDLEDDPTTSESDFQEGSDIPLPQTPQSLEEPDQWLDPDPKHFNHEPAAGTPRRIFSVPAMPWSLILSGTFAMIVAFRLTSLIAVRIAGLTNESTFPPSGIDVCQLPVIRSVDCCWANSSGAAYVTPKIKEGLNFSSTLAEIQTLAAKGSNLPYLFGLGEAGVRSLIAQVSKGDSLGRESDGSVIQAYRQTADTAIDDLSLWLEMVDRIVQQTIDVKIWTQNDLLRLEKKEYPWTYKEYLGNVTKNFLGTGGHSTAGKIREELTEMVDKISAYAQMSITTTRQIKGMDNLKNIIENFALQALRKNPDGRKKKLMDPKYWRHILRQSKNQVSDFEAQTKMLAHFYKHVKRALLVLNKSHVEIEKFHKELQLLKRGIKEAPLTLWFGKSASIVAYVEALKEGVEILERSKNETQGIRKERMKKVEEVLRL